MTNHPDPVGDFWTFWQDAAPRIAAAVETKEGLDEELIEDLSRHVAAIDPDLQWELGPGAKSKHHVCVSAAGNSDLRVVAERWLRRAPEPDAIWEYYPARQASPDSDLLSLSIGGHDVSFKDIVVGTTEDDDREVLDVALFHPGFPEMKPGLQRQIVFIALDNTLGEDGVERWVGNVDVALEAPAGGLGLAALSASVRALAAKATGEKFAVLRGEIDGHAIFVTRNGALKRIDHLSHELHVALDFPLLEPTDEGLTTREEAETLNEIEDDLLTALGDNAVYVARETTRGHRIVHLHAREGGSVATTLERFRARHITYALDVQVANDPQWEILQRW